MPYTGAQGAACYTKTNACLNAGYAPKWKCQDWYAQAWPNASRGKGQWISTTSSSGRTFHTQCGAPQAHEPTNRKEAKRRFGNPRAQRSTASTAAARFFDGHAAAQRRTASSAAARFFDGHTAASRTNKATARLFDAGTAAAVAADGEVMCSLPSCQRRTEALLSRIPKEWRGLFHQRQEVAFEDVKERAVEARTVELKHAIISLEIAFEGTPDILTWTPRNGWSYVGYSDGERYARPKLDLAEAAAICCDHLVNMEDNQEIQFVLKSSVGTVIPNRRSWATGASAPESKAVRENPPKTIHFFPEARFVRPSSEWSIVGYGDTTAVLQLLVPIGNLKVDLC